MYIVTYDLIKKLLPYILYTLCPEKVVLTTFVNNNLKSQPIVKVFYIQNQQNNSENILYSCWIISFRFLSLASCLLTVPVSLIFHWHFTVVSGQSLLGNSASNLFASYLFSCRNIFYQYCILFRRHFANSMRFFLCTNIDDTSTWTVSTQLGPFRLPE